MYQCTIEQHRAAEAGGQGITNFRSSMDYGDGGKTRSELHKIYKLCELCELLAVALILLMRQACVAMCH